MDGPNVNWKFYTDLAEERNSEELLNIGSCVLHIVHGGLQKGANESGRKLGHLMRSLWQLFHDTPARSEEFVKLTGFTLFPLKCCPHRWVEDVDVAERALQMWTNIKKYVSSFRATPKKAAQTTSYSAIKEACEDPLTVTQLEFFISVAKQLQPTMLKFQTDAPMAPFLGQSLKDPLLTLMGRFIRKDVLEQADSYPKLAALDPCDKKKQVHCNHVEFGFAARQSLKAVTDNKTIFELAVLTFKTECVQLLSAMTAKLIERCPLKYTLVRYLSSLNPPKMISSASDVTAKFENILQILMNGSWRSVGECDELLSQYKAFLVQMKPDHAVNFRDFTPDSRRLDTFLGNYMQDHIQFAKLWDIFKMLLTISHGQASVERGYSVNKDLLIENLHEKTVVVLRTVDYSISTLEDHFTMLPLTPAMKPHVKSARMRYGQYLDEQKKESLNKQQRKKRNGVQLIIREAERKKCKVETSIDILGKEADDLAKSAEAKHDFTLLTKSNVLRLKVAQQSQEIPKLEKELKS